ncbi:MAG: tetratricopeptide repeat protein [Planctomycetota bacterium]
MRIRLAALLLLAGGGWAQDATLAERFFRQQEAAFAHYNRKEWNRAIAAFEQQIAIYSGNPNPYYNIACCYALQGDAERAATWLSLSINHGWRDAEHLGKDPDFAQVRQSEPFKGCLAQLERARRQDPAPMPRRIPPESVSSASSVRTIMAASRLQENLLQPQENLLTEHQYRKQLFHLYDRRMALLGRYLAENGDAPDADEAAEARVRTAMAYLMRATGENEQDRRLRGIAARHVLLRAEEFLRGFAPSPRLPRVRYWRAHALARLQRSKEAEQALRTLLADHGEAALQARVELCALLADRGSLDDLRREYRKLDGQLAKRGGRGIAHPPLAKARLLAEGMPTAVAQALRGPAAGGDAPLLFVFVSIHSVDSELRLKQVRELAGAGRVRPVVVCADLPQRASDEDVQRWLEAHAPNLAAIARGTELFRALWLSKVPTLLLVRNGGEVLAFDPTEKELADTVSEKEPTDSSNR